MRYVLLKEKLSVGIPWHLPTTLTRGPAGACAVPPAKCQPGASHMAASIYGLQYCGIMPASLSILRQAHDAPPGCAVLAACA